MSDRAAGCIVGALVGDALGVGPHWYYDLEELRRDYGPWIDGYTAPKPGRYHAGLRPGEPSQTGLIIEMLLASVAGCGGYDEADFCRRLDEDLLPKLDGAARSGPGGFTNHSIRQAWHARVKQGRSWGAAAGNADTSEAAERATVLAARYAADAYTVARTAQSCCLLTQDDSLVVQHTVAFALVLAALIRGHSLDGDLADRLMSDVESGAVPFVADTSVAASRAAERPSLGFASPDALLLPSWIAEAARDPGIRIEPPWKVSVVYGMSCLVTSVLSAAYYLAARFSGDFERAVLHALNGGGQNMSRACLAGALVGAQVGLSGIPRRFIEGLAHRERILEHADRVARGSGTA